MSKERVEESLLDAPGSGLVPATFMVIFGTVVVYGLSAAPLARYLGLASVNPQGVLIAGANSVARQIAAALQSAGYAVLLVDRNPANIRLACMEGLRTVWDDILSESAVEDLDLGGIGRFLGMTPNAEVNSLGAMQMIPLFGRSGVFQLPTTDAATERDHAPNHLRARTLFNGTLSHAELERQFVQGARLKTTRLSDEFTYNDFLTEYGGAAIPLFISEQGKLTILTTDSKPSPKSGQTLISLVNVVPQRDLAKRGSERSKS
ncbi:MAG: NAD-binding protein [Planctomycetaceae bacterium]